MHRFKLNEAKVRLLDLIEAALRGEDIFILKDDRHKVKLVPFQSPRRKPQFGAARGLIAMSDDFDAPLADFGGYMA